MKSVRFLLVVSLACLGLLIGCLAQPTDAVTGAKVGDVVSLGPNGADRIVPATNPANGNPVILKPTKQVDWDRVQADGANTIKTVAPILPPPWDTILSIGGTALMYELARRRERKALFTPAPAAPPDPGKS